MVRADLPDGVRLASGRVEAVIGRFDSGLRCAPDRGQEVVGGFLDAKGKARGRPVGLAVDNTGALLIADDVGNTVWRVTKAPTTAQN